MCIGTSLFSCHFTKGNKCDFLFASLDNKSLLNQLYFKKKESASMGSKFFSLLVIPFERGGKHEDGRVISPENVSIYLTDSGNSEDSDQPVHLQTDQMILSFKCLTTFLSHIDKFLTSLFCLWIVRLLTIKQQRIEFDKQGPVV